jgi:hypothetical protein
MNIALLNMKRGQVLQAIVLLAITFLVWDSYHKAMTATEQLMILKHEESMMLLHLKRLEEQSHHLHESIAHMTSGALNRHQPPAAGSSDAVDADLIKAQTQQLQMMEDELNHEVKSLQAKIQQSDRARIIRTFGEGPVQVSLDVDFPQDMNVASTRISILLWYDTPHAAWTLIDQIRQGAWKGATFSLDKNLAIIADPLPSDVPLKRLDFVEKGQKTHEAWTVGLSETDSGRVSLFINLQDNTHYHKTDVCVGKIIDGFDVLQRLTRASRDLVQLTIKTATAAHLTRKDTGGIL